MLKSVSSPTYAQIGGATGLVGDPSGRLTQREFSEAAQIEFNAVKLVDAIHKFFNRATAYAAGKLFIPPSNFGEIHVLNNINWLKDINLLDFLRNTGIHFRINHMLGRDRHGACIFAFHQANLLSQCADAYERTRGYDFHRIHVPALARLRLL